MEGQWFEEELAGCRLGDGRLDRRLRQLVEQMEAGFGESIPLACQDWANTKAAYRFFSNDRVSEEDILRGHFDATRRRFAASDGPILVLHDTTEFSRQRRRPEAVGFTTKVSSGKACGSAKHSGSMTRMSTPSRPSLPSGMPRTGSAARYRSPGASSRSCRLMGNSVIMLCPIPAAVRSFRSRTASGHAFKPLKGTSPRSDRSLVCVNPRTERAADRGSTICATRLRAGRWRSENRCR